MRAIRIGDKIVAGGGRVFIIAEAGSNHNGKLSQAKKLVDAAARAGADAVKFQTFRADKLFCEKYAPQAVKTLRRYELTAAQHKELNKYAKAKGLIFLSTPFDEESSDMLDDIGVAAFKIASYELTHLPLVCHVARKGKPVILSTGMARLREIKDAVRAAYSTGNRELILLHCVSQYPADHKDANLRKMLSLGKAFKVPVGYSDHTRDILPAVAAAAMGAAAIEKHFTLDRKMKGPDHFYALEPEELGEMVRSIRAVEECRGDGRIIPSRKEVPERKWRRSIYARVDIPPGGTLTRKNVIVLRPARGLQPKCLPRIMGKTAKRGFKAGKPINDAGL